MLEFLTIAIMALVGYAFLVYGLFTGFVMCVCTVGAGLVAFNFFEPLADQIDLYGYEDIVCMVMIFVVTLAVLRTVVNMLSPSLIEFDERIQRAGGAVLRPGYRLPDRRFLIVCPADHTVAQQFHWVSAGFRTGVPARLASGPRLASADAPGRALWFFH